MGFGAINLLHVEDDVRFQQLIAHYLRSLDRYQFSVTSVGDEQQAIAKFRTGGIDFVLLDYDLEHGNGLSCLRQLRRLDPIVPIIVLSENSNTRLAGELLKAGADDYVRKQDLTKEDLDQLVGETLTRSRLLRQRRVAGPGSWDVTIDATFQHICRSFIVSTGSEFVKQLDQFESAIRKKNLTIDQIQRVFETACVQLTSEQPEGGPAVKPMLRPILLELIMRLFGNVLFSSITASEPTPPTDADSKSK